jgi:hypothetical protein
LIAPERSLLLRVFSNVRLKRAQARHDLVRAPADFTPQERPRRLAERHCYNCENLSDGFGCYARLRSERPLNNKSKTKTHRPDRVRRKR